MKKILVSATTGVALALAASTQAALVQFSNTTTDSYASNFQQLALVRNAGSINPSVAQDNTNQNLVLTSGTSSAGILSAVYDNPSDSTPTTFSSRSFTASIDVKFSVDGASFGFYIGTRAGGANDILALFNVNSTVGSGTKDWIRFCTGTDMSVPNITPTLTTGALTDTGLTIGQVITLTLTATPGSGANTNFALSATNGTDTLNTTTIFSTPLMANYEVGIRGSTATGSPATVVFDNFSVVVPEPASLSVVGVGAMGLLGRRRRVR